jgi:hypothetical protein
MASSARLNERRRRGARRALAVAFARARVVGRARAGASCARESFWNQLSITYSNTL